MMRRFGLPVLPLILGVILGPRLEKQLRTSLQLSDGHVSGLWSEPVAVVVYVVVAVVLAWPLVARLARLRRTAAARPWTRPAPSRRRWTHDERRGRLRPEPRGRVRARPRDDRGPLAVGTGWWW